MQLSITSLQEKWRHAGFQKYLKNTGWLFFGRFFTLGVSFFVGAYIARYLGPANYGLMNYAVSFAGLFGFLASFGIDGIVSREIVKNHAWKDRLIGTAFYLKIIGALLTITVIFIVSVSTTHNMFTLLLIWLFSLSYIPQAFNIIETYFQSQVLSKNVVRAQIISTLISTGLKLLVIFLNRGIFWIIFVYVIEASLIALFLLISFKNLGYHFRSWKFNRNTASALLRDSWPLMLSGAAIGIYMKIDQVMIKNMLGDEQAGLYAVVVKLSEVWYFIPVLICASLSPAIIKSLSLDKKVFENRMKKLYSLLFGVSITIALIINVFSYQILNLIFGNAYVEATSALQVYVWAGIFVSLGLASTQYLIASGFTKISFYNTALGMILNIVLNIILIPKMGLVGAAIATLIAYGTATFGILIFKKTRNHGIMIFKSIINIK